MTADQERSGYPFAEVEPRWRVEAPESEADALRRDLQELRAVRRRRGRGT